MAQDTRILVNLQRCTGCWTCSLACKVVNELPYDEYWATVRTLGSGEGIDRPAGTWPNLSMSWMPVWSKKCIKCAPRLAEGQEPFCVKCCPNSALTTGEAVDAEVEALREKGFRIFSLPAWESTREGIVYASKE
ncbi:MAG: hypothetical protein PEGG_00436 [Paraeggerthella hongkongensis]